MENIFNNCSTLMPEKLESITMDFTDVVEQSSYGLILNGIRISPVLSESLDLKVGDKIKATEVTPYNYGNNNNVYIITKCEKL